VTRRRATVRSQAFGLRGRRLDGPLGGRGQESPLNRILAGVEVAVTEDQRTPHLRDQPPDLRPAVDGDASPGWAGRAAGVDRVRGWAHMSGFASCMRGRTSIPQ
jgi:hypothetical protein